ncbi:hypothetical protein QTI66_17245 [Variovorax sp. J22R133]|uniref:hypothetical protein n=1 Tax=Variovorax brevis TaxID=3053503 RepID=UPI0025776023|nr:hypothetical protein [Variovorax sp. J22R133]MDM0113906.1 hypothetical protein [Variovorax sp. J22R133]
MKNGAYVFCRPIDGPVGQHQFLVLAPGDPTALSGYTKPIGGEALCVVGAYNIAGHLRASLFAPSDVGFLTRKLATPGDPAIQTSKVELQACLVGSEDPFLQCITRCYSKYRTLEGTPGEIRYPSITEQLDSNNFNSNSWAQSILFWAQMMFVPGKNTMDFNGLDIGNDRRIPKSYFFP